LISSYLIRSSRNRLSPRFINKATTTEPIQEPSYKQIKINKKKENQNLPPKTPERNRGKPELHDDASNKVTTQRDAVAETETVKDFHPEPYMERVPTTMPPRGLRYPQASPSLALKR
jgi:hypothetical protein